MRGAIIAFSEFLAGRQQKGCAVRSSYPGEQVDCSQLRTVLTDLHIVVGQYLTITRPPGTWCKMTMNVLHTWCKMTMNVT